MEGITISNSVQFFLRGLSSDNLYRNVKTVGAWIYNNDGFSIGNNGAIEDCFIHANDDAIKVIVCVRASRSARAYCGRLARTHTHTYLTHTHTHTSLSLTHTHLSL